MKGAKVRFAEIEEDINWSLCPKITYKGVFFVSQDISQVFSSDSPVWQISSAGHMGLWVEIEVIGTISFYDSSLSVLKRKSTNPLFELILSAEIITLQVFYLKLMPEVVLSQGCNTNEHL